MALGGAVSCQAFVLDWAPPRALPDTARLLEAIQHYGQALAVNPEYGLARSGLAAALLMYPPTTGRVKEIQEAYLPSTGYPANDAHAILDGLKRELRSDWDPRLVADVVTNHALARARLEPGSALTTWDDAQEELAARIEPERGELRMARLNAGVAHVEAGHLAQGIDLLARFMSETTRDTPYWDLARRHWSDAWRRSEGRVPSDAPGAPQAERCWS